MTDHPTSKTVTKRPTYRQIVFNWLMGESDFATKLDGYWGGTEEVAKADELIAALGLPHRGSPVETTGWQPIGTADTSRLFATSTWVLVATDDGRVTEAMPLYVEGGDYIWIVARGNNLKGNECERSGYLRDSATHWMPLPKPPCSSVEPADKQP